MSPTLLYSISSVETELTETREHWLQSDVFIRKFFLIILAQKVWKNKDSDLVVVRIQIGNFTMSSKAKYVMPDDLEIPFLYVPQRKYTCEQRHMAKI